MLLSRGNAIELYRTFTIPLHKCSISSCKHAVAYVLFVTIISKLYRSFSFVAIAVMGFRHKCNISTVQHCQSCRRSHSAANIIFFCFCSHITVSENDSVWQSCASPIA